jgi:hypothetical protein
MKLGLNDKGEPMWHSDDVSDDEGVRAPVLPVTHMRDEREEQYVGAFLPEFRGKVSPSLPLEGA